MRLIAERTRVLRSPGVGVDCGEEIQVNAHRRLVLVDELGQRMQPGGFGHRHFDLRYPERGGG